MLLDAVKEALENKWYLAVRATTADEHYKIDDMCRESYEWDLENDCSTYHTTGETAGGTCGLAIETEDLTAEEVVEQILQKVNSELSGYGHVTGQNILIAGRTTTGADYQMDNGEIRIRDAWVQAII